MRAITNQFFLSCLVAVAFFSSAGAQTLLSLEGGVISSAYSEKLSGRDIYLANKTGGRFCLGFDSRINKHLNVQTGLQYMMNGYRQNASWGDVIFSMNTLVVPINAIYKTEKATTGGRVFIGAGPYFGFNMFGSVKRSYTDSVTSTRQANVGNDSRDDIRYFDFGLGVNGGYELKKGLFVRVNYQMGLANMNGIGDGSNSLRNSSQGVSIGYYFGTNREKMADRRSKAVRNYGLEM